MDLSVPWQATDFEGVCSRGGAEPAARAHHTTRQSSESVVVPWHARLRDAKVFHGGPEHHALGELLDHVALYLLPRSLARRVFVAALFLQRGAALREFGVRNE